MDVAPSSVARRDTRTRAGLSLVIVTSTPPCWATVRLALAEYNSPAPSVTVPDALTAGGGLTVTVSESGTTLAADAVTVVVHGSVAVPPYVGVKLVLTSPFWMVTVAGTETQA